MARKCSCGCGVELPYRWNDRRTLKLFRGTSFRGTPMYSYCATPECLQVEYKRDLESRESRGKRIERETSIWKTNN